MPSTDRKLELKVKTSVAQTGSQPFVYAKELTGPLCPLSVHGSRVTKVPGGPQTCILNILWLSGGAGGGGGYTRNIFRGRFNKFSWGQRAERTGIWGQQPPIQGFRSIFKLVKPVFWLGCYGCIFHGTGNSAQLFQSFGISGVGVWTPTPQIPPRYATALTPKTRSPDTHASVEPELHTQRIWAEVSSCAPHLLHDGPSDSPIK
jgi:hypothetical protein